MPKEEDKIKEVGEILDSLGLDQRIICGMESGHEVEHMLIQINGKAKVVLTMVAAVVYKIAAQLDIEPVGLFIELAANAQKACSLMDKVGEKLKKDDKISINIKGDGTNPEDIKVNINKD